MMKKLVSVLIGCVAFTVGGCMPAKTSADVRADARAAVSTVEAAWSVSAQTCVDWAAATDDQSKLAQCAGVLDPIRNQLIAADAIINGWTDASQAGPLSDSLSAVIKALNAAAVIEGVPVPPAVVDAEKFALVLLTDVGTKATDGGHE